MLLHPCWLDYAHSFQGKPDLCTLAAFGLFIFEQEETDGAAVQSDSRGCTGSSAFLDGLAGFGSTGYWFSPVKNLLLFCNFCCSKLCTSSNGRAQ